MNNANTEEYDDFEQWADFKQSTRPSGRPSSSQRRWFRIHAAECEEDGRAHTSSNIMRNIKGVRVYLVPMTMTRIQLSVRDALELCSNPYGNHPSLGVSLAEFEKLGGNVGDSCDELYRAQTESPKSRIFSSVHAVTKPSFQVHLSRDNELLLSERSHTSVHLRSEFTTLSDFVSEHCHTVLDSLQSSDGIASLTSKLKGVHIATNTSGGRESLVITGFSKATGSEVTPDQQHHAWPSSNGLTLSPNMPLVNVGTVENPLLLPMEACQISQGQLLHGPRDVGLNAYINSVNRAKASQGFPAAGEEVQGNLVFHTLPERRSTDLKGRVTEACDDAVPNLLFVQAVRVTNSNRWLELRDTLRSSLRASFRSSATSDDSPPSSETSDSTPLLSLSYAPGRDLSARWTHRLHNWLQAHHMPEKKTVVVVWLEPEQDHNMMYNIIKRACEINAGLQTFFVKRETYDSVVNTATKDADPVARTAADICRRFCAKNPRMLSQAEPGDDLKIVIAMHVAHVSHAPNHGPRQNNDPKAYVVTLVSRDLTRSEQYDTERGLFSKSEIETYSHVSLLKAFFDRLPNLTPGNFTILRSGYMPSSGKETGAPDRKFDLTDNARFGRETHPSSGAPITVQ
jgi:hypothetical protein